MRPILVYATTDALGGSHSLADTAACAVELVHSYSLVHDDLPAMDDDDLRRGKPTCHIAFDEATAILVGDALQTLAFDILSQQPDMPADRSLAMIRCLAQASGAEGMVAGQAIDLASTGNQLTFKQLQTMHRHKTGALIRASVQLGALAAGTATPEQLTALDQYADAIGLAFQVQDDILDVESDTETLGKQQGADSAHNKPTYTSILGLAEAKAEAQQLLQTTLASLKDFDDRAEPLRQLARYIVERKK